MKRTNKFNLINAIFWLFFVAVLIAAGVLYGAGAAGLVLACRVIAWLHAGVEVEYLKRDYSDEFAASVIKGIKRGFDAGNEIKAGEPVYIRAADGKVFGGGE